MSEEKSKAGRPSGYDPKKYPRQAFKLCLLGADNKRIASFFDVSEDTIKEWVKKYPAFATALKNGKDGADAAIADSLYHRAKGFSHDDVHVSNYMGQVTITKITKHYPPDTTACIFWLKNRQRDQWRDKVDVEHSGEVKTKAERIRKARERVVTPPQQPVIDEAPHDNQPVH